MFLWKERMHNPGILIPTNIGLLIHSRLNMQHFSQMFQIVIFNIPLPPLPPSPTHQIRDKGSPQAKFPNESSGDFFLVTEIFFTNESLSNVTNKEDYNTSNFAHNLFILHFLFYNFRKSFVV